MNILTALKAEKYDHLRNKSLNKNTLPRLSLFNTCSSWLHFYPSGPLVCCCFKFPGYWNCRVFNPKSTGSSALFQTEDFSVFGNADGSSLGYALFFTVV